MLPVVFKTTWFAAETTNLTIIQQHYRNRCHRFSLHDTSLQLLCLIQNAGNPLSVYVCVWEVSVCIKPKLFSASDHCSDTCTHPSTPVSSQSKLEECNEELQLKKRDIAKLQERDKALTAAFQASLGENNPFEEFLTKVFKKKVKRVKNKEQGGNEGEGK